ncbi:hypothetical protein OG780_44350 [Streptomyces sp. NBC_00386]|uniref:hypothetical protein n=1 Tax=Streptomyces sp. NBC_00386 TaxID=2975734 RepID=UPI002E24220F
MAVINPWAALAHGGAGLAELREAVVGEAVRTVRYVALRGEGWPEGHREDRAHEVDVAVELGMESGSALVLSWAMDGVNEGMAIELRNPGDTSASLPGDPVDVSDHVDWEGFLGVSIAGIGIAWHIPNDGCPEMPWAYNFRFANESNVVIALGEADGAGFTYMPDALLVIFDKALAAAYKIPASATSSCG